ncbi:hypothetical protein B0A48_02650 [Cryoendolithus antarcticus]|uniref:Glycosyl hydrolase family 13 catalytic domain-containing protein n=1 Tax=Cryoendolithus antarcticus TaxID=1507870 RepID=A0A1V8TL82_9PEZI|nr:hypothetical protein B0A48_02650 [Cryoendolithus antarcticus]
MNKQSPNSSQAWWKEAVIYQIYPASFLSTGSGSVPGWGDIKGVISKLDYLKHLGVDIVWLSPIFKSPQADMGYDISDYKDIDPRYGTLEDVDELIAGLKKRGMKVLMDLVVNHTSDHHAWFLESRSSKSNSKRDWYHWQPPKQTVDGKRIPPNNWASLLGEANSAWTWDEETQEYYLSLFTPEQPDLNWENPQVRAAIHDVLRFWLERGANGFREDVINMISKVPGYPDAEVTNKDAPFQPGYKLFCNGPKLHEYLHAMNREVISKYEAMTVGEMPFVKDEDEIIKCVGADRQELNEIFLFDLVDIDNDSSGFRMTLKDFNGKDIKDIQSKFQRLMLDRDGWNSLFIENHDNARSVTRYTSSSDTHSRNLGAKLLALMQTTLAGTLFIYQGEELAMANVPADWPPSEYIDIESVNYWNKMSALYPNDEEMLAYARKVLLHKSRDHARTPVQWNAGPNAGFCAEGTKPWMRVNDDYKEWNAEAQRKFSDPEDLSVLQFWKRGMQQRKEHKDCFVYGDFELLDPEHESVFAYRRFGGGEAFVVVLNFSGEEVKWEVPAEAGVEKWVTGNYKGKPEKRTEGSILLRPWEGLLGTAKL